MLKIKNNIIKNDNKNLVKLRLRGSAQIHSRVEESNE